MERRISPTDATHGCEDKTWLTHVDPVDDAASRAHGVKKSEFIQKIAERARHEVTS